MKDAPNPKLKMYLVSSCNCLCAVYWSHVLSREWRCSWSSADRQCSNYIWVNSNLIVYKGASYIRDLTVLFPCQYSHPSPCLHKEVLHISANRYVIIACHYYLWLSARQATIWNEYAIIYRHVSASQGFDGFTLAVTPEKRNIFCMAFAIFRRQVLVIQSNEWIGGELSSARFLYESYLSRHWSNCGGMDIYVHDY